MAGMPRAARQPLLPLLLVAAGLWAQAPADNPNQRLFDAVRTGDLAEIEKLHAAEPAFFAEPGAGALLLHIAANEGHPDVVAWLLQHGANANEPFKHTPPLFAAIDWTSDINRERRKAAPELWQAVERQLAQNKPGLDAKDIREMAGKVEAKDLARVLAGMPPDLLARKARVLDLLLAAGADAKAADKTGLVVQAVMSGFGGEVVRKLAAAGADAAKSSEPARLTALHVAASQGNADAAGALLDLGLNIEALYFPAPPGSTGALQLIQGGNTPLMCAIDRRQEEMVRFLLERGAKPDTTNHKLARALHYAAGSGHTGIIRLLLARRARVDVAEMQQVTPLGMAATHGHVGAVQLLCEAGADPELADSAGFTPLLTAAEKDHLDIVKYLLERGANRRAVTDARKGLLRVAATANARRVIEYLLANGEPVDGHPSDICTPLHEAASSGHADTVALLLANGASLERVARGIPGTPLFWAVMSGPLLRQQATRAAQQSPLYRTIAIDDTKYVEIARLLLEKGAQVDTAGAQGNTPLHVAAEHNLREMTALLLKHGARFDLANARGLTPRDIAHLKGHREIVTLLDQANPLRAR